MKVNYPANCKELFWGMFWLRKFADDIKLKIFAVIEYVLLVLQEQ